MNIEAIAIAVTVVAYIVMRLALALYDAKNDLRRLQDQLGQPGSLPRSYCAPDCPARHHVTEEKP